MGSSLIKDLLREWPTIAGMVAIVLGAWLIVTSLPKNPGVLVCANELALASNTGATTAIDSSDIWFSNGVFYFIDDFGHRQMLVKSVNDYCVTIPRELVNGKSKK
jgi:hypothetical protein